MSRLPTYVLAGLFSVTTAGYMIGCDATDTNDAARHEEQKDRTITDANGNQTTVHEDTVRDANGNVISHTEHSSSDSH